MNTNTPYSPANNPFERTILMVSPTEQVLAVRDNELSENGAYRDAFFVSQRLSPDPRYLWTLHFLHLYFTSMGGVAVTVDYSLDGGNTWVETQEIFLPASGNDKIETVTYSFQHAGVDPRFRIRLGTTAVVVIYNFKFTLVRQGLAHH